MPAPVPMPVPGSPDPNATETRAAAKTPTGGPVPTRLRAVHPEDVHWIAPLARDPLTIGRTTATEQTPALPHATVSRRHYQIAWDARAGHHVGTDLGSHNGTRIDGSDAGTAPHPLRDGTIVQLGDVTLVVERGEPGDAMALEVSTILGASPAAGGLRTSIARAAPDPSPVLVVGETGTGKEFVAREIHRLSARGGPLVAVNCAALNPELVDSQLFGHVKGAFTGAATDQAGFFRAAHGGTLFLDEIGEMPLSLQPKLLRALQEGVVQPVGSTTPVAVDVRVVAATNRRLDEAIEASVFRRDLYARLSLWEIEVPPLRERRGDLLSWFACLHAAWCDRRPERPRTPLSLAPDAVEALLAHAWPHNLRELDRLVHELCTTGGSEPITRARLPGWITTQAPARAEGTPRSPSSVVDEATPTGKRPIPTRQEFVAAFEHLAGNVRALAKHFDRDRRQIYRWIESYGLADRRSSRD